MRTYAKRKARGDQEPPTKRPRFNDADWTSLDSEAVTLENLIHTAFIAKTPVTSRSDAEHSAEVLHLECLNWNYLSNQAAQRSNSAESPFASRSEAEQFISPALHYSESSSPQNGSDLSSDLVEEVYESPASSPPSKHSTVTIIDAHASIPQAYQYSSASKSEDLLSELVDFHPSFAKLEANRPRRRLTLKPSSLTRFAMPDKDRNTPLGRNLLPQPPGHPGGPTEDHLTLDISESDSERQRRHTALGFNGSDSSFSFGDPEPVGLPILKTLKTEAPSPTGTGHPGYSHVIANGSEYVRGIDREKVVKKRVYTIEQHMEPRYQEQKAERRRRRGHEDHAEADNDLHANTMRSIDVLANELGMTPETPEQQEVRRRLAEADNLDAQTGRRPKIDVSYTSYSASFAASEGATFEIVGPRQPLQERRRRMGDLDEDADAALTHLDAEEFTADPHEPGQQDNGDPTCAGQQSATNSYASTRRIAGDHLSLNFPNWGKPPSSSAFGVPSTTSVSSGGSSMLGLVQTTLTGGRPTVVKCRDCGFHYNRAVPEDVLQHVKSHTNFLHGIALEPDRFFEKAKVKKLDISIDDSGERYIVMIQKDSSKYWKDLAAKVLQDQVDRDLQCAHTPEETLWETILDPNKANSNFKSSNAQIDHVKRFAVFLQVKPVSVNGKRAVPRVVGALLAERISAAYEMMNVQVEYDESEPFPLVVAEFEEVQVQPEEPRDMFMGVNKIWVHKDHRRERFAFRMVETARNYLIHWHVILRDQIAFSPPTEAGAAFAKYWTNPSGFHLGGDHLLYHQYAAE